MSWQFGEPKPTLMDEEYLRKAIDEQTPPGLIEKFMKAEGIFFDEVLSLRLGYKNILTINTLWEFTSLTTLYLNNNSIQRIGGLEHLVNLTWLNLSFNRIEKIEGLGSLKKLEVLDLSNNKITVIENMEELENLTHFWIAENNLDLMDNVLVLRKLKKLSDIKLFGNPLAKEEGYKLFMAAFFPNLLCVDSRVLSDETKREGSIKHSGPLEKMRQEELQIQQAEDAERSRKEELQLHTDAFVELLNGPSLFKSMFEEDPEAETLLSVAEVANLFQIFEEQMVELCIQIFEIGLVEHKRREEEVNCFLRGRAAIMKQYQEEVSKILKEFERPQQERLNEMQNIVNPEQLPVEIAICKDALKQLSETLMSVEVELHTQQQDIIHELDINISALLGSFTETVQGIFTKCRDLEDNHHQKVREIASATVEKVVSESGEKELSADVKWLFSNKNMVMDALGTGHDNHLLKLGDRENEMLTRVDAWKVSLIKGFHDKELERDRTTVKDIQKLLEYFQKDVEDFHWQDI